MIRQNKKARQKFSTLIIALITAVTLLGCDDDKAVKEIPAYQDSAPQKPSLRDISDHSGASQSLVSELLRIQDPVARAIDSIRWTCKQAGGDFSENLKQCLAKVFSGQSFAVQKDWSGWTGHLSKPEIFTAKKLKFGDNILTIQGSEPSGLDYADGVAEKSDPSDAINLWSLFKDDFPTLFPSYYSAQWKGVETFFTVGHGLVKGSVFHESPLQELLGQFQLLITPGDLIGQNETPDVHYMFYEPKPEYLRFALGMTLDRAPQDFFELSDPKAIFGEDVRSRAVPDALRIDLLAYAKATQKELSLEDMTGGFDDVYNAYQTFRATRVHQRFEPSSVETPSILGCVDTCDLKMPFAIESSGSSEAATMEASWTKRYVRGALAFSYLSLNRKDSHNPEAVILLNAGGSVSMILIHRVIADLSDRSLANQTVVYDRNWNDIGFDEESAQPLASSKRLDELMDRYAPSIALRDNQNVSKVLICDSTQSSEAVSDHLLTGPYTPVWTPLGTEGHVINQSPQGSLEGWLENKNHSVEEFLASDSGIHPQLHFASADHADHGSVVSSVYASAPDGNGQNYFARMDGQRCLEMYDLWKDSISQAGIRVVNFSRRNFLDNAVCDEKVGRIFKSKEERERFLWVIASGNDSSTEMNPMLCPQNLLQQLNTIVVAATDESGNLFGWSNRGADWVDIAAYGVGLDAKTGERHEGSSFAAPRVTDAAARLARRPGIGGKAWSIAMIRLSLIVGAKIPRSNNWFSPLPVRSGGVLDESTSEQMLDLVKNWFEKLQNNPQATPIEKNNVAHLQDYLDHQQLPGALGRSMIRQLYQCNPKYECREADAKIDALTRGHILVD